MHAKVTLEAYYNFEVQTEITETELFTVTNYLKLLQNLNEETFLCMTYEYV